MSHGLRKGLMASLGEKGFMAVYSLVALIALLLMIWNYRAIDATTPFWVATGVGEAILWVIYSALMLLASLLLMGSFFSNPAMPIPDARRAAKGKVQGVFRITRHPMMWGIALWALVHFLLSPRLENLIFMGGIGFLALFGSHLQESKKFITMGNSWVVWTKQTCFFPFANGFSWPGNRAVILGVIFWLVASWAHGWLGDIPAGIFRWIA